jgi:hypothetical protein
MLLSLGFLMTNWRPMTLSVYALSVQYNVPLAVCFRVLESKILP